MNVEATKLDILQTIVNSTDANLLTELQQFLKSRETDWFDQLLPSQQQDVMDGIAEADRGETTPHKEVVKRFSKWGTLSNAPSFFANLIKSKIHALA